MIPQVTGVQVTSLAAAPTLDTSLTFNLSTLQGRNKISRVINSAATFYAGTAQSDNTIDLPAAVPDPITSLPIPTPHVVNLLSPTKAIQVTTQRQVKVTLTVNSVQQELIVNKLLIIDSPATSIEIANFDVDNPAKVILTYLT